MELLCNLVFIDEERERKQLEEGGGVIKKKENNTEKGNKYPNPSLGGDEKETKGGEKEKERVKTRGKGNNRKVKETGSRLKDQSIRKFLIKDLTPKEKTGEPVGNDNNTGINNRGGGGLLCHSIGENITKPESSTQSISNDVLGGEKGRR